MPRVKRPVSVTGREGEVGKRNSRGRLPREPWVVFGHERHHRFQLQRSPSCLRRGTTDVTAAGTLFLERGHQGRNFWNCPQGFLSLLCSAGNGVDRMKRLEPVLS